MHGMAIDCGQCVTGFQRLVGLGQTVLYFEMMPLDFFG